MSNPGFNNPETADTVFDDPVAYLADCGIEAEIVAETVVPAAA